MDRREFFKHLAQLTAATAATGGLIGCSAQQQPDETLVEEPDEEDRANNEISQVAVVFATDRATGVHQAVELIDHDLQNRNIFIKPNFNSADPAPGSTHNDVLEALVRHCHSQRSGAITVGDRSGMGETREVMRQKQIFSMGNELDFETIVFDELDADDWEIFEDDSYHWQRGFALPRPVLEADAYIQTCALKTHRFGGHFTMALKNNVGLAARTVPDDSYNYMEELHSSDDQRIMIAELNDAIRHELIVLDGVEGFYEEGPDKGPTAEFNTIIASTDPVAIDALGVALLRRHGTTAEVEQGPIAELEQIARAIELGVGTADPDRMDFVTPDDDSEALVAELIEYL